jgi:hypothetical protein
LLSASQAKDAKYCGNRQGKNQCEMSKFWNHGVSRCVKGNRTARRMPPFET